MKVLVTGAAGLVGYNTCKYYINRGHEVIGLDNLERSSLLGHEVSEVRRKFNWNKLVDMGVDMRPHDVSKADSFVGIPDVDAIVHLAGQCGVPTSIADPRRDFEVNTLGTLNVLEFARACRDRGKDTKVAFASTNKVYNLHAGWYLPSETAPRWEWYASELRVHGFSERVGKELDLLKGSRTPYGNSKFMADAMCQEWFHMYGVPTGVFRMSCIYGPNQFGFEEQGWAVWFCIAALKGQGLTFYGDGKQVRDMLYVDDLVRAYDAFIQSSVQHGVWNIGGGPKNTLSLNECVDFLRKETGAVIPVEYKDWRPSDQRIYTSDIRDLEILGWQPVVSPMAGLRFSLDWVRENIDVF